MQNIGLLSLTESNLDTYLIKKPAITAGTVVKMKSTADGYIKFSNQKQ